MDVGAEAFVARRPEVPALLAELGLADRQISTTGVRPTIYSQGRLHPLPPGHRQRHPDARRRRWPGWSTTRRSRGSPPNRSRPLDWRPGADPSGRRGRGRPVRRPGGGPLGGSDAGRGVRRVGCAPSASARRCRRWPRRWTPAPPASPTRSARRCRASTGGPVFGAIDGGYEVLLRRAGRRAARLRWVHDGGRAAAPPTGTGLGAARRRGLALARRRGRRWRVPGPAAGRAARPTSRRAAAPRRPPDPGRRPRWCWRWRARRHPAAAAVRCAGGQRRTPARQGDHAVHPQVGQRAATANCCGCRSAGSATHTRPRHLRRRPAGLGGRRPGDGVRHRRRPARRVWCTAGSTRCRSTGPGTPSWSPSCGPVCRRRWRWRAATSTASGCPRAWPRRTGPRRRVAATRTAG